MYRSLMTCASLEAVDVINCLPAGSPADVWSEGIGRGDIVRFYSRDSAACLKQNARLEAHKLEHDEFQGLEIRLTPTRSLLLRGWEEVK